MASPNGKVAPAPSPQVVPAVARTGSISMMAQTPAARQTGSVSFQANMASMAPGPPAVVRQDMRQIWMVKRLKDAVGNKSGGISVEDFVNSMPVAKRMEEFFSANGPNRIMFLLQRMTSERGSIADGDTALVTTNQLVLTDGFDTRLRGKCIYFFKRGAGAIDRDTRTPELDIGFGEATSNVLECFHHTLRGVFQPQLENAQHQWMKCSDVHTKEYLAHLARFDEMLADAVSSLQGGIELRKPEKMFLIENKQHAYQRAAADPDVLIVYETVMEEWIVQCERLLAESDPQEDPEDNSGPSSEFEFWRNRMAKFNSVAEQLKQRECKCVIGVVSQSKSKVLKRWKAVDNMITESLNEAKDNVKYLSALEKYTEPLYTGTPATIIECLPALMNNAKMMLTIARYYGTSSRMTTLFIKLTNQIITNCKNSIMRPDPNGPAMKLWDQDIANLLDRLKMVIKLHDIHQGLYKATKEKLAAQPKGKQFDFNETLIFGKFDALTKRVQKLHDMFTTVHQFTSLSLHNVEGMEALIQRFFDILADLKRKPYDMLDFTKNAFDRDFLEYNVNIAELEAQVQNFINMSFENILSTEQALTLLKTFESILVRESLKADLDSKYTVIFHNYGMDLETVQRLYEKQKASPPMVRNAAPVTGNILWAKLLLRRIEDPMRRFKSHSSLMQNSKDAKKIVKMYNKVARALVEFETLWHNAWIKSIEAARSGLQATLIVRHPRTHKLFVNFDREILQLIRETKTLQRVNVVIPQAARMVLHQEDKFKSYFNQLTFALKEYDRVVDLVPPVVKDLLSSHVKDLESKIEPGMVLLTWQSMNIDSYLQRIHSGLSKFEELVRKVCDILENRVEGNLKSISKTLLVELPSDQSFTLEQFVMLQEKTTKTKTAMLDSKNQEVERAISDVIHLLKTFPLETPTPLDKEATEALWVHYAKLMYLSVLRCTKQSFFALKKRLKTGAGGFLYIDRPFFDVDIELSVPLVTMNPSLDEIQAAINRCALNILRCSKSIFQWAKGNGMRDRSQRQAYHHLIGQDYQIVAVCLMLTGAVEGTKKQVHEYLQAFMQYDFLWKENKQEAYEALMQSNPDLDAIDQELQKYSDIEAKINNIPPVHNIGCLSLETGPLKNSLRTEATMWKVQYTGNMHKEAVKELEEVEAYMKDLEGRLGLELEELEDARKMMGLIREVRDKETEIDMIMSPIEQKYALLLKYDAVIDPDELARVTGWQESWREVVRKARVANEDLNRRQEAFRSELVRNVSSFIGDVKLFRKDFMLNGPVEKGIAPLEAARRMTKFEEQFREKEKKWHAYSEGEALFGLPITSFPELEITKRELELLGRLYSLYINVLESTKKYKALTWAETPQNIDSMLQTVNGYLSQCRKMPKQLREWEAYTELKKNVEDFLEVLPLLQNLCSPAMRSRHWRVIQTSAGTSLDVQSETLLLGDVLSMCLQLNPDDVEETCQGAVKELEIEQKLQALNDEWSETRFEFQNFKNKGPVLLKARELQDIVDKLEESSVSLSQMANNRYSAPFKDQVSACSVELASVSEVVELWTVVQSRWVYMEAVFLTGDIAKQLPQEAKRFAGIDKSYMMLTAKAFEMPNVIQCCHTSDLMKKLLPHLAEQLELCQRSLTGYLEQKRAHFPRFFFISDASLLEILSHGSDAPMVASHLREVFEALVDVSFDKQKKDTMVQMVSREGEEVAFSHPLKIEGTVEEYMTDIVTSMQGTLKDLTRDCAADLDTLQLDKFVRSFPAQTCVVGLQMMWTSGVQDSISKAKSDRNAMPMMNKRAGVTLQSLISMASYGGGSQLERTNVEALIVTQQHLADAAQELTSSKVRSVHDFDWQRQLRVYWDEDKDECNTCLADVSLPHGYEFQGCTERLVVTPATSKCWISLTQAVHMFMGFSAVGPQGGGKAETVREFGRQVAKYTVSFSCTDQMDHMSLGKIFKGVAIAGSWGLFSEFHRVDPEVVSVASQQLGTIMAALRERRREFVYTDGQHAVLNPGCSFLLTMSSGARAELPINMRVLFRSYCLLQPNTLHIARVMLAAAGYQDPPTLARKFDSLYALSKQQLGRHPHYDFGVAAVKAVLRTAALKKRQTPQADELQLLMGLVRDATLPMLVPEDVPIFLSHVDDVLPGFAAEKATDQALTSALRAAAEGLGLDFASPDALDWSEKVVQLHEALHARHGVAVVGAAGGGKTALMDTVSAAMSAQGSKHAVFRMNPQALTPPQMFGRLDRDTGDWEEGAFVALWRKAQRHAGGTWIVMDGPVDGDWVENLDTVLDDARRLTISNGDAYPMGPRMRLLFETDSFRNAPPSTVSRAGIVHVAQQALPWKCITGAWLSARKEKISVAMEDFMPRIVAGGLEAVYKQTPLLVTYPRVVLVSNMLSLLSCLISPLEQSKAIPNSDHLERLLLFSVCWAFGSMLERDQRLRFETELRRLSALLPAPDTGGIFDNLVAKDGTWLQWKTTMTRWTFPTDRIPRVGKLVVPTPENTRSSWLLQTLTAAGHSVLITGVGGVGKTSAAMAFLHKLPREANSFRHIALSRSTRPDTVRGGVAACLEKRQAGTYAPPGAKTCYVLVDDLCAPQPNRHGDQPALELLRQLIGQGGYYNPQGKAGEWRGVTGVRYIATHAYPDAGRGRHAVSERLTRLFFALNVSPPTPYGVEAIFGQVLRGFLSDVGGQDLSKDASKLGDATQSVCARVLQKLLPTPVKLHYSFDLRQIARVVQGLLLCDREMVESREYMIKLWRHECECVFGDMLSSKDDKDWTHLAISQVIEDTFGPKVAKAVREQGVCVNFMREEVDLPVGEEGFGGDGEAEVERFGTAESGGGGGIDRRASLNSIGSLGSNGLDEAGAASAREGGGTGTPGDKSAGNKTARSVRTGGGAQGSRSGSRKGSTLSGPGQPTPRVGEEGEQGDGDDLAERFLERKDSGGVKDGGELQSPKTARTPGTNQSGDAPASPALLDVEEKGSASGGEDEGIGTWGEGLGRPQSAARAPNVHYVYEFCSSTEEVRARLEDFVLSHDSLATEPHADQLDLVMFDSAVSLLVKISRVLALEGGSCLLVGAGGSGRTALARLAGYIAGHETVALTKGTRKRGSWSDEIRHVVRACCGGDKHVCLLVGAAESRDEGLLDCLHQLLSTGECVDLFSKEDWDSLNAEAAARGASLGQDAPHASPAAVAVMWRLHVVAFYSNKANALVANAFRYPALQSYCHVIYFLPWPEESLVEFAESRLSEMDQAVSDSSELIAKHMSHVYASADAAFAREREEHGRPCFATPISFISYVDHFASVFDGKHKEVTRLAAEIATGLQKLDEASQDIEDMREEIAESETVLQDAQRASADMLKQISARTAVADKKRGEAQIVRDAAEAHLALVDADRAEIASDMEASLPAIAEAEDALRAITPKDFATLKALKSPPTAVKLVLDAVLILRGKQVIPVRAIEEKGVQLYKDSYPLASPMVQEPGFVEQLLAFDKERVTFETLELLQPYVSHPLFTVDSARKASPLGGALAMWVKALVAYKELALTLRPKTLAMEEKDKAYQVVAKQLVNAQEELDYAQADVDTMQSEFEETFAQKKRLQDETESTKRRMVAATALLEALEGEKARWTTEATLVEVQKQRVLGDCLVASCFLTFCGQLGSAARDKLLKFDAVVDLEARDVAVTGNLSLVKMLSDDAEVGEWYLDGLPGDDVSRHNALLVCRSVRWPLLLDPQGIGGAWIRRKEEGLKILSLDDWKLRPSSLKFMGTLEECLMYGKPLMVEHSSGALDVAGTPLERVADKRWKQTPKGLVVRVGDQEVPVDPKFKLYLCCQEESPDLTPEISTRLNVVSFAITQHGLEEQLLQQVVKAEKPELFSKRRKTQEEVNACMQRVKALESEILTRLSTTPANLLEDSSLIEALSNTKKTWREVQDRLKIANDTEAKLQSSYEDLKSVAERGSLLFFLMNSLSGISRMYHTSLSHLQRIFTQAIDRAPFDAVSSKRIANIIDALTLQAFQATARGLLERHKPVFALLLSMRIQQAQGMIQEEHLSCLLAGGAGLAIETVRRKPYNWVPDGAWLGCVNLFLRMAMFKDLPDSIQRYGDQWRFWFESDCPETLPTPEITTSSKMTPLGTLLLLRAMRPDRVMIAARTYVHSVLGDRFDLSVPLNMDSAFAESTERTPLVCIITPGAELADAVYALAKRLKKEVLSVSMGEGQSIVARKCIDTGISIGNWVLLQNAHMSIPFLEQLQVSMIKLEAIEPLFRLWITTQPHEAFPLGILQMSVRIANEAPRGIKASLKRTYASLTQDVIDAVSTPEWRMLLFVTSFLHAVLHERRSFGAIGFVSRFDHGHADLQAAWRVLQNVLQENDTRKTKEVSWQPLRFLVGDIQYGGRVTDQWDKRLFAAYTDRFFTQANTEPGTMLFKDYPVLAISDISAIRTEIESLPDMDSPELFGLSLQAELVAGTAQSHAMLGMLGSAVAAAAEGGPRRGGSGLGYQTGYEGLSKMCSDLLERLPLGFIAIDLKAAVAKDGGPMAPFNVVLRQEVELMKQVLAMVKATMDDVRSSIAGAKLMTDEILLDLKAFHEGRLPPSWEKSAWRAGDAGLAGWLGGLMQRCEQWRRWIDKGRPAAYWLTGLLQPRTFLNAIRQEHIRKKEKHDVQLEDLVLFSEVTKMELNDIKGHADDGVYIHSLVLEGCGWHKRDSKIVDNPTRNPFVPIPILHVTAVSKKQRQWDHVVYEAPVYMDKTRTGGSIFSVEVKTDDSPAKWTMRGVAILASRD